MTGSRAWRFMLSPCRPVVIRSARGHAIENPRLSREAEAGHEPDPGRQPPRHLPPSRALREPDRHARRRVRRGRRGVQRGAVPLPPRQRPDPADALGRWRTTWSAPEIVLPWSDKTGNWDCGFCELADGTWLVNLTITGHFKRGIRPEGVSWAAQPNTKRMGRLDLGLQAAELARHFRGQVQRPRRAAGPSRSRSMSARSSMAAAGWAAGSCPRAAS